MAYRRSRKRRHTWLRRLLGVLVLLLALVGGGGYYWLRSALPQINGTISLAGAQGPIDIIRDENGVPTIKASSDADAAFALGFVHAQERLFQMDLQRRLATGQLSEVIGTATLDTDRQMREFGFRKDAVADLEHMSPEFRAVLQAYAAGVNAFIAQRPGALPMEFYALRYRPAPWEATDTLAFAKLMSLELSGNYRRELLRARLATKLNADQIKQLFPDYPIDGPIALGKLSALYNTLPLDRMLTSLPPSVGPTPASNNWVVDGKHSATGKPLLANDPHLGFSAPGTWFLARIETPDMSVVGGTLPGAPVVVLGHNQRIAWGYTTTNADVEDLFIEKVDPTDPTHYLTPDGSKPFETRTETIAVRGESPVTVILRSTRHGPVISDASKSVGEITHDNEVIALSATFIGDDDTSAEAQWRLSKATDWPSFIAALKLWDAPEQNMVYADVDGNIGFYAPARIPIRRNGDGLIPVPGWTGEYDWTGFVPFEDLPHAFNPASGHIATANNKIVPDSYPYMITKDWELPFRAEEIENGLAATPEQSIEASTQIMRNDVSLTAKRLLPLMLKTPPTSERARQAQQLLGTWDFRMRADRPEPLIFTAWLRELNRRIYADELGDLFPQYWDSNPLFIESVLTKFPGWCDNVNTPEVETCDQQVGSSLEATLDEISHSYGNDMTAWHWGAPHVALFAHSFFSRVPILRDIFDLQIEVDGGNDTVNATVSSLASLTSPYTAIHGAGLRAIYDLDDLDRSVFMIAPGESGHRLSPHYSDLLQRWHNFEWMRLPAVVRGGNTLHITPQ